MESFTYQHRMPVVYKNWFLYPNYPINFPDNSSNTKKQQHYEVQCQSPQKLENTRKHAHIAERPVIGEETPRVAVVLSSPALERPCGHRPRRAMRHPPLCWDRLSTFTCLLTTTTIDCHASWKMITKIYLFLALGIKFFWTEFIPYAENDRWLCR